ncbi:DNA topoisomerase 2-like [Silene latifolia]|uniref:DNA topoisomerase 2-like n=1 Tax=Silene latifolia TaxID=37657 RepID=UPI003D7785E2
MAQNYVGSNNVNLLIPNGQFGTRYLGGKDGVKAKYARYMNTKLADVTRCIFPKEDDVLLDYLKENGLQIEPLWYLPIIPMVLVNGSQGIGTGSTTFIPNYNPRDIIANIRRLINNESLEPMDPWYKNFKGTIQRIVSRKKSGVTYTVTGTIDLVDGHVEGDDEDETDVKLLITELPIRKWTQDYHKFVETMEKDGFIKRFDNGCFNEAVEFTIVLSKRNYNLARQEGLVKKFKLTTSSKQYHIHPAFVPAPPYVRHQCCQYNCYHSFPCQAS